MPALIWVVLGTILLGAVHDFSTLVMSTRHRGRSVGHIVADVIDPRTRTLFQLVIFFLVMMVIVIAIAKLFMAQGGAVIPKPPAASRARALIARLLVAQPEFSAPAFHLPGGSAPAMVPFLFVTIACGAIYGFHGLVSSGTTSKQLERATDARLVGYGAMIGEGTLVLISTLAVSAGLANWAEHYETWSPAGSR